MEMHTARSLMDVHGIDAAPARVEQGLVSQVLAFLRTAPARFVAWQRYRAELDELSRLDDRMLNDIGLRRSDVERIARAGR